MQIQITLILFCCPPLRLGILLLLLVSVNIFFIRNDFQCLSFSSAAVVAAAARRYGSFAFNLSIRVSRRSRFACCAININFFCCSLEPKRPKTFFVFSPINNSMPLSTTRIIWISLQLYVQSICDIRNGNDAFAFILTIRKINFSIFLYEIYLPAAE